MHVVLTGATGLIGSAVVPQLVARGDRVTALVRSEEAVAKVEAAGATGSLIDFGDRSAIAAAFAEADAVIHLAAAGDDAEAFDRRVAEAAVQGARRHGEALRPHGRRLGLRLGRRPDGGAPLRRPVDHRVAARRVRVARGGGTWP